MQKNGLVFTKAIDRNLHDVTRSHQARLPRPTRRAADARGASSLVHEREVLAAVIDLGASYRILTSVMNRICSAWADSRIHGSVAHPEGEGGIRSQARTRIRVQDTSCRPQAGARR
jgi:hypothetical protein